jgi:hypothetical protein
MGRRLAPLPAFMHHRQSGFEISREPRRVEQGLRGPVERKLFLDRRQPCRVA